MTYKNGFEPKDARIFNTYQDVDDFDDIDDWALETPRRRKTGTQALVDFLNTTGPDELQKTTPTKKLPYKFISTIPTRRFTTSSFFLRRRNKSKSSTSSTSTIPSTSSTPPSLANSDGSSLTSVYQKNTPNTIQRKNYIEIVAPGQTRGINNQDTTVPATKLPLNEFVSGKLSYPDIYTGASFDTNPIFSATVPINPSSSPKTYGTNNPIKIDIKTNEQLLEEDKKRDITTRDGMDMIEAGLIQRLKRCQLSGSKTPYGANSLIGSSATTETRINSINQQEVHCRSKKVRHAQVQTLPCDISSLAHQENTSSATDAPTMENTAPSTHSAALDLQRQLEQERQKRQQLESTLKATCDHFEILSDLADRKLRELWEEKLRWEHACIDLNDDLMRTRQGDKISQLIVADALTEVTNKSRIP